MNSKQIFAAILIIGGALIISQQWMFNFVTILAAALITLGIVKMRRNETNAGYIFLSLGTVAILVQDFGLIVGSVLLSLGWFYLQVAELKNSTQAPAVYRLFSQIKQLGNSWPLSNQIIWEAVGEDHIDFSLCIPEESNVTIIRNGLLGNLHIRIPKDMDFEIDVLVLLGQVNVVNDRQTGIWNQRKWNTQESAEEKVKIKICYLAGNVTIEQLE